MERYYVYEFVSRNPILVDTKEKTATFYHHNIYGKIYDLKAGGEVLKISSAKINGLIKRLNNGKYNFYNSLVLDKFIYYLLMTDEQKAKCQAIPKSLPSEEFYGSSNNYEEIIAIMCECTFDKGYAWGEESKEKEKDKEGNKKYYTNYLAERKTALIV